VAAAAQKHVLIRARALIANRNSWTKRAFARTAQGRTIAWNDALARRWCAVGAIRRAALELVQDTAQAERIADNVVKLVQRGRWFPRLVTINDFSSHRRVLARIDRAIERL
jgi:YD repeat-containing protein